KSSCRVSSSLRSSSSAVSSRISLAFKKITLPGHELGLHRQLHGGEPDRLAGERLGDAGELEHDAPRLHDGHPVLGRALARAHAGLGRLLGHGLVGEDRDPHLAAALDLAGHRDTSGLDLAVGDPPRLERLQAVLAELYARAALGEARAAAAVDAPVLRALRKEHYSVASGALGSG